MLLLPPGSQLISGHSQEPIYIMPTEAIIAADFSQHSLRYIHTFVVIISLQTCMTMKHDA